jgi:thioredoxin reductase
LDSVQRYDVVVVGAGSAGLSAALVLGRSRRRTLVLDGGEPRNAPSSGVHSFFSRDGILPAELLRIGREQLELYRSVEVRRARATGAAGEDGGFEVTLDDGSTVEARKLVLASGVVDELPETPGFRELWGRGVYHCPYCHGWEVRDRPLAVYARGEEAIERATLIRNWSRDLVVLSDGPSGLDAAGLERLASLGVPVKEARISRLASADARAEHGKDGPVRVLFEDGVEISYAGLFYMPTMRQRSGLAESLGCEFVEAGPVSVVGSDPLTRETTVPGVYVAGDAGNPIHQAILAASTGASAGAFANNALTREDAEAEVSSAAGRERTLATERPAT